MIFCHIQLKFAKVVAESELIVLSNQTIKNGGNVAAHVKVSTGTFYCFFFSYCDKLSNHLMSYQDTGSKSWDVSLFLWAFIFLLPVPAILLEAKEHSFAFFFCCSLSSPPQWRGEDSWNAGLRFHVSTLVFMSGCERTASACLRPWDCLKGLASIRHHPFISAGEIFLFLLLLCLIHVRNFNQEGWRKESEQHRYGLLRAKELNISLICGIFGNSSELFFIL